MIEGWFVIPKATSVEEASKLIIQDSINKVLDYSIRDNHLWTLIKFGNLTVINCYLIEADELGQYCYQPSRDEDYPIFNDIPFEWVSKISSSKERKKEFNQNYNDLDKWVESIINNHSIKSKSEIEIEKEMTDYEF